MNKEERAKQIARIIQEALQGAAASVLAGAHHPGGTGTGEELPQGNFTVTKRGGCSTCDPGSCSECGYLFMGEAVVINHRIRGKLTLSDKAVHYLSHGITRYQTSYIVHGEPVIVDLDLDELASYLDL
jgi:hypothetical protein